ncbi:DUF1627 domain-containing protein, partial [Escherichia coli]
MMAQEEMKTEIVEDIVRLQPSITEMKADDLI